MNHADEERRPDHGSACAARMGERQPQPARLSATIQIPNGDLNGKAHDFGRAREAGRPRPVETEDVNKVERTWMNIHIQHEGTLPLLNGAYSPTAV
jgi:hypothetical protein